jgi:hypothetical protein
MRPELTISSPFVHRLLAWVNERFPWANAVLFLLLYLTAVAFGQVLTSDGPVQYGLRDIPAFMGAWCFFLMLRVFDEHKDYELDCHNHPERVLQSGLITLGHLKVLGAVAIFVQIGVSVWQDGGVGNVTLLWIVVMGWSALMAKEFFMGEWLSKRLVLYAISHMVVMPMALIWMAQMGAGHAELPLRVGLLAALSFLSGFAFEITRKTKAPEDERDTIDSYTKIFGTGGAPLVVMVLLALSTGVEIVILDDLLGGQIHWAFFVVLMLAFLLPVFVLQQFRGQPDAKRAKSNEGMVALSMLTGYLVLMVAMILIHGLVFS